MNSAPSHALEHLAERIHAGEVVFFVGAGFSIDSEGLSAELIIKRLLVRLDALDRLHASPPGDALRGLASVFGVADTLAGINASITATKSEANSPHRLDSHLSRLAFRYYELNSWLCQAFAERFTGATPATYADFTTALQKAEADALAASGWATDSWSRDRLAFTPIPEVWWEKSRPAPIPGDLSDQTLPCSPQEAARLGKLVFIQSTGLFSEAIMAGETYDPRQNPTCYRAFARTYGDRLRPRHHVIARLAREGLCSTLVTTNFDLLLEGAFRLAGFHSAQTRDTPPIPTSWPRFDVIASPEAFFTRGKAFRTATVVKLHGCAGLLRKKPDNLAALADYLSQLVYTYREIQNWRDDSWAAEFLRTLLRTRAFVFSGYSTADPVLHDTFRSVYEEMSRKLGRESSPSAPDAKNAPAYFLAYSGDDRTKEFHAYEVLASASRGVGAPLDSHDRDHPNYLRFAPGWAHSPSRLKLDETMLWLQHRILRRQQTDALRHELPSLAAPLLGRRPAPEFERLWKRFDDLVKEEAESIEVCLIAPSFPIQPTAVAAARRQLEATTAWSHGFHPALRREWAHAAAFVRRPGSFREFAELQHPLWYYPAGERPDWTAWSAVLELALRELARLACAHGDGIDASPRPASAPPPA
ncbi:MAG: SIR2 family protein, partial [Burkholderiales bacterium]|nr:SIR2 family protein [Opitutaceae bacterium]